MRLITKSKIYRAFPELDSYDDDDCQRFVARALESMGFKLATAGVMILMLVGVIPLTLYLGAELATEVSDDFFRRSLDLELTALFWMIGLVLVIACAFWVRDVLIGRRVRRLLRTQGRCVRCNYSLLGLEISPELTVVCPECGMKARVDRALCELVRDEEGRQSFVPRDVKAISPANQPPRPMRFITRRPIYRAFPELDSYDDHYCIVFLNSAKRPLWFRLPVLGLMVVLSLGGFAAFAITAMPVVILFTPSPRDADEQPFAFLAWIVFGTFVTGVIVLRVRDRLIRRRILTVLRRQGRCRDCDYSLVGMSVAPDLTITCPECGMINEVDPALSDLARDDLGRQSVAPPQPLPAAPTDTGAQP
ncbi:MAG: hypothetical protein GC200_01825 [Tepidisphaera sp.]|nr:hypothetical protein [Tepidisphaera sp.]